MSNLIEVLKNEIAHDNLEQALNMIISADSDNDICNEALLLKNRIKALEVENNRGIVTYENYKVERNKIVNSLLNLVVIIEKMNENESAKETTLINKEALNEEFNREVQTETDLINYKNDEFISVSEPHPLEEITANKKAISSIDSAPLLNFLMRRSILVEFDMVKLKNDKQLAATSRFMNLINSVRSEPKEKNEANDLSNNTLNSELETIIKDLRKSELAVFYKIQSNPYSQEEIKANVNTYKDSIYSFFQATRLSNIFGDSSYLKPLGLLLDAIGVIFLSPIFLTLGVAFLGATLKIDILTIYLIDINDEKISLVEGKYYYHSHL